MQLFSSPSVQRSRSRFANYAVQLAQNLAGALTLYVLGMREGLDLASRYVALNRLSDHALAERGLTRGDIARAVLEEFNKRKSP